jgi:hypothetical protein
MKAALKVVAATRSAKGRKSLKEVEAEFENYSGWDPEDPLPSNEPSSPWESFAEK